MMKTFITPLPVLNDNYIWIVTSPDLCFVVDPALASPVIEFCENKRITPDYILNTHHHADHTGGNLEIQKKYNCPIVGPAYDSQRIPGIDKEVQEGDSFKLNSLKAQVYFTPGHTRGHIVYWFPQLKALFCGDTLFSLGCGRLFEGTPQQMWNSLMKIKSLPQDTKIYCAHEYTYDNARFALSVDPQNKKLKEKMKWIQKMRQNQKPTIPSYLKEEIELNPFLRPHDKKIQQSLKLSDPTSEVEVFAQLRQLKDQF